MAKKTIALKIDVTKINKDKLFKAKSGAQYLDAVIFLDDDADQYGQNGMVVESVSQEERAAGTRGSILGNVKVLGQAQSSPAPSNSEGLPF